LGGKPKATETIGARSSYKATWPVTLQPATDGILEQARFTMRASAGALDDAVEITLPVYNYSTPEVTGTSGQVAQEESRLELVRLPADADRSRGQLDLKLEPSLAAGMLGGLKYLEHYPYECIEQTMSRFLPNVVTYQALKTLNLDRPDLADALPAQVAVGLQKVYAQQHIDGGWGWWQKDESNPFVSGYVVFGLARAKQAGFTVDQAVLDKGTRFLQGTLKAPKDLKDYRLNEQAFTLYALAEAGQAEPNRAGALYEERDRLSLYAKAYLALTLGLIKDGASPARIQTLVADITGKAVVSATGAHWEEGWTDYWNMNTDTRTTTIVLDVLARLDPKNTLGPNTVRWLMATRAGDRWQTTQENAWAIMALTEWMASTGELVGDYSWQVLVDDQPLGQGTVTPATVSQATTLSAGKDKLSFDRTNALLIKRSASGGQTGNGQLYYAAHLKSYLPVDKLQPVDRGLSISREYRQASCVDPIPGGAALAADARERERRCQTITTARVGDVISVRLNVIVPNSVHYLVVEDPLPAGAEAIDTSLRTTEATAQGPEMRKGGPVLIKGDASGQPAPWTGWWWTPTHTDMRDEKVSMFATYLAPGTYEFTYQVRATLPGQFLVLPATAYELYFPEVWGRNAGSTFSVTE
jgi:uncharacterized protein YfaS (alpha-2-macroglobulin family)